MAVHETTNIAPSVKDTIEYIEDMISSLNEMARQNNLETLAGILELARREASLRAKDCR